MDNTLEKYGFGFQIKVLASLLVDRDFLIQSIDLIDSSYFQSKSLKWILEQSISYFKQYKIQSTLDVFKIQISNIHDDNFKSEIISNLKKIYESFDSTDLEYIKKEFIEFCKHQEIAKAYDESIDDFKAGNYAQIGRKFEQAIKKGQIAVNFGHNYKDDVEYRYTEQAEPERVATGFKVLDEVTNGGLPKGTMGIIIAPSGIGKSWLLAKLGSNAIKAGKKVLHITLELKDVYTAKRYDSLLTGIPFDDLKYHQDEVKKAINKLTGDSYIVEYPPSTLSLIGLETLLEKFKMAGIEFDEVLLDYPELMKIDFTGVRDDNVLKQLYNDLTGLAGRFNFALWAVDQTNRGSSDKDVIGNDGISNAFSKVFIATVVMTLSRKIKDKMNNTARLHLSKSRLGPDGITFPCKFDTYNAIIEVYNEKTENGKQVKEEMKSDHEYEQEYAAKQFQRFSERKQNLF